MFLLRTLIILFLPLLISAQSAEEIVKSIQHKFDTIEDLKADFVQEINSSASNKPVSLQGKFFYQKGNKFRIEVRNRFITSDGSTVWNYDISNDKVVISNLDDDAFSFSLEKIIYEYPSMCKVQKSESGPDNYTLILNPKNSDLFFKSAIITTNKSYIVTNVVITDFNSTEFIFNLKSVKINSNLSNKLFNFSASEGTQVIDLR